MNEVSRLARCLYGVRERGTGERERTEKGRPGRRRHGIHGALVAARDAAGGCRAVPRRAAPHRVRVRPRARA